jgi:hypothetical protein
MNGSSSIIPTPPPEQAAEVATPLPLLYLPRCPPHRLAELTIPVVGFRQVGGAVKSPGGGKQRGRYRVEEVGNAAARRR